MGNACIGLLNHKFFILYLFYVVNFCSQVTGPFLMLFCYGERDSDDGSDNESFGMFTLLVFYPNEFISLALATALMLGIGFMLVYQIVILLMNKTTMEVSLDPKSSPFRHKGIVHNIRMIFGDRVCYWFSPFHDPFPDMKLVAFTPSERQLMQFGVPVKDRNSGRHGLDYIQCIIPTVRSV
uniref:Palmitoyltransferase n=1 Tax=Favella ehrenbergii TaxID=182087 RepID=A0A7S3I4R8_9SPIT|mmetsp:Transcript_32869/g.40633  ORF Transcript_32869/g.40633 Transcript_32869/m.40633 type:complete len:181 (+) Transcript_32869:613-1155(+)